MRSLAANDLVRWIDGLRFAGGPDIDDARHALRVDEIQGYDPALGVATGLTGVGIRVGVYDGGIDTAHDDFDGTGGGSRVLVALPVDSSHATYVAGIIAGNGERSDKKDSWDRDNGGVAHQWRGIAPAAELIDAAKVVEALASNSATLRSHITSHGMDLSNHSYWLTTDGEYGGLNGLHDALIRGDDAGDGAAVPPRLHVHSAGNFGMKPRDGNQRGYFSLGNQLKNALVVGNYYVDASRVAITTSLGPTHDGRIKPDVVAPGAYVMATGFCTATDNPEFLASQDAPITRPCDDKPTGKTFPRRDFYYPRSGGSTAAAAATGVLTLVLEELVSEQGINLDTHAPLPSTLRALVIHSARDLANTPEVMTADGPDSMPVRTFKGPDFVSGFGVVDAAAAVDIVRRGVILEGVIGGTCETKTYNLHVPKGSFGPLKVTLAWDDPATDDAPEIANDQPRLINDLDLVLISPLGKTFYPWLLDQETTDLVGAVLPNNAQPCGTDVLINRRLTPTATPWYPVDALGNELPGIVDDPITEADLVPAGTGKDHLNNLEQVVAAWSPGVWRVEVSGFRVEDGPQRFSLIGVPPRLRLPFRPFDICQKFAYLCEARLLSLCIRYRRLCKDPDYTLVRADSIVVKFRHPADRKVIDLSMLCHALNVDRTCADTTDAGSPELELTLGPMSSPLGVELFDGRGSVLGRDTSHARLKRIRVPRSTGAVFVFLSPGRGVETGVEYAVPIAIRRIR